jgi:murein DD-endopeptidase MepM/ murein hydrolase activator NlpD
VRILGALVILLVVACQPRPVLTPFGPATPNAASEGITAIVRLQHIVTPLPTHTPRPVFASPTPTIPAPTATSTLPPPTETPARATGYLMLGRPILDDGSATVSRVYPYGGTNGGRLQAHHGVDLVNPIGTPVHASGDGTVVYAGNDLTARFAPINDYYGNLVIIQHNIRSAQGQAVFTLYGHLANVTARAGQVVREGDVIGVVGATGIALGPHLHLEIRVGSPFDFDATRNPELWVRPFPNFGVLAGQVVDSDGEPIYGATLVLRSSLMQGQTYTYADDSVNPDPVMRENFSIGDLPAGEYTVTVVIGGRERFEQQLSLLPDQLTWLYVELPQ